MLKPCRNCPFRSDEAFSGLTKKRKRQIHDSLMTDNAFHCHKTIDYSSGEPDTNNAKLCVGSMIYLENVRPGGMVANVQYRLVMMYKGLRAEQLSKEVPVFKTLKDFLKAR